MFISSNFVISLYGPDLHALTNCVDFNFCYASHDDFSRLETVADITSSEWKNWGNKFVKQWKIAVLDDVKKADHVIKETNETLSSSGELTDISENWAMT